MARKTNGTKAPTCGGQQLDNNRAGDSRAEVAEKLCVSTSLVDRLISGERRPTPAQIARLTALYRIPAEAWNEPLSSTTRELSAAAAPPAAPPRGQPWSADFRVDRSSPLPGWLQRLCREGTAIVDEDADERDRTANVIASTLREHPELIEEALVAPLAKHPETIADIIDALRPYAGEVQGTGSA